MSRGKNRRHTGSQDDVPLFRKALSCSFLIWLRLAQWQPHQMSLPKDIVPFVKPMSSPSPCSLRNNMLALHEHIKNNAVGAEDVCPGHVASALCSIFSFLQDSHFKTIQLETYSQLETVISTNVGLN